MFYDLSAQFINSQWERLFRYRGEYCMTKMWQMTNYVYKCNKNRPLVKTEKKQNILNNDMFNEDVEIVYYEGDTEDVKTLGSVIIYIGQGNT